MKNPIVLVLAAALATGPGAFAATPTRRSFACMLGLGGFMGLAGVAQLGGPLKSTARPAGAPPRESPRRFAARLGQLLPAYAILAPGMATNLAAAKIMDLYKGSGEVTDLNPDDPTYLDTVVKAQLLLIAEITLVILSPMPLGNAGLAHAKSEILNPLAISFTTVLLAPVVEELAFRLLPSLIARNWAMGTTSAAVFAGLHALGDDGFDFSLMPLTQFTSGIFYWYLIRERGFDHAVLAHASHNNAISVVQFLLNAIR